jgi:dTDP-6-deoxy-L-talose 4-dehydrogenase (NAD+)
VLVTGANGYVGRHVVIAAADAGHDVTAVVRPGSVSDIDPRARVMEADILESGFDVTTLDDQAPDVVIHLAWQDGFRHNAPSHMLMLSGHFALLEHLADWGVGHLSVLGTMHEVGYWEGAIDADTPTAPTTLYGIAKDALRRSAFATVAQRVPLTWLRCYYIYGDDRRNNSIFARLLEAVDAGKPTFPFTTGKNRYDFITVDELARQIVAASTQEALLGVINCATGEPMSLAEKVEEFIRDNDLPITLEYGAFPDRPYDSPGVWGDAAAIRSIMAAAD